MASRTSLDPLLRGKDVEVEPEELLEPELEAPKGRPKVFGRLRVRLSEYGNRVLMSGRHFLQVAQETISNIGTALAGSIVFLPLLIVARAVQVLANGILEIIKPLLLSIIRALFDALRAILWPLHEAFTSFNKTILFPLIKRIREDDTTALIAFGVLIIVVVGIIYLLSVLF